MPAHALTSDRKYLKTFGNNLPIAAHAHRDHSFSLRGKMSGNTHYMRTYLLTHLLRNSLEDELVLAVIHQRKVIKVCWEMTTRTSKVWND